MASDQDADPKVQLERLIDMSIDLICIAGMDGYFKYVNPAWEKVLGYSWEELLSKPFLTFIYPADHQKNDEEVAHLASGKITINFENRYIHKDGSLRTILWTAAPWPEEKMMYCIGRDITKRKLVEEELKKSNRALKLLSSTNQVLIRATEESTLMHKICRIVINSGYRLAWVGMKEEDEEKSVRPAAQEGFESGYLEAAKITWADNERGRGPTGTAIRTGKPAICRNMLTDPSFIPWREQAIKRGYQSSIALPLGLYGEKAFGALNIYAAEPDAFDEQEVIYLGELAADLAFGIVYLREQAQRKRAEEEHLFHLRFVESLDKVNRAIQGTNDLNQMMNNVLEIVLSIFDCDRAWLFYPCDPDAPSFRVPMEITKPEYPGAKALNVDVPMPPDMAQNLREALESADPVTYTVGTEKPINKVTAEQFGVKSQMVVPLYPKSGKPWVFGLHQCSIPRIWTKEEKMLFKEISNRISDGLSSLLFLRDLQESEELYKTFINSTDDLAFLKDDKFRYILINDKYSSFLSKKKEEIIGRDDFELLPQGMAANCRATDEAAIKEQRLIVNEEKVDSKIFETLKFAVRLKGGSRGIGGYIRDISERKKAEEAIHKNEAELKEAQRIGNFGNFDWDAITDTIIWSDEYYRIYGFDPKQKPPGYEEHLKTYSPESAARLDAAVKKSMQTGEPYTIDLEQVRADGTKKWLTARGEVKKDANGQIVGLRGTAQDITERKRAEAELKKKMEELKLINDLAVDREIKMIDLEKEVDSLRKELGREPKY